MSLPNQDLKVLVDLQVKNAQAITGLQKDLNSLSKTSQNVSAGFKSLGSVAKTLAASFVVKELLQYTSSVINLGDELKKASEKSGIAVATLAQLRTGAELAGVGFDQLQVGLKKLSVGLVEAAGGNRGLEKAFANVNISGKELKTIGLDGALSKISDAFKKSANGPEKAALAVKLFGRAGTDLIPFLNQGSDGIKAFGISIGPEFAEQAERFNDDLKLMKNSLLGIGIDVIGPALRPISDLIYGFVDAFDLLITRIRETATFAQGIASAFGLGSKTKQQTFLEINRLENGLESRGKDRAINQVRTSGNGAGKGAIGGSVDSEATKRSEQRARDIKKETQALNEYLVKERETVELRAAELNKLNFTGAEYRRLTELKKFDAEADREATKFTGSRLAQFRQETAAIREQREALLLKEEAQRTSYGQGAREAIAEYTEAATNSAALVKEAMLGTFKQLEDALVNFVKTGKLNFKSLADFVIDEIIRMSIKQGVIAPLLKVVGGLFGAAVSSSSASGIGGGYNSGATLGNSYAFANGGIMSSRGEIPVNAYARGGIARGPQVSLFGEGSLPEAYVPLPNGRSIPVVLAGGSGGKGGGDVQIGSIQVNMGGDTSSVEAPQERGKAMGRLIVAAIQQEIIKQKRNGGLLANG